MLHALVALGLKPGLDIEIVGINNEAARLNYLTPQPASVDIHAEKVGRRGIEQLLWRLDHPHKKLRGLLMLAKVNSRCIFTVFRKWIDRFRVAGLLRAQEVYLEYIYT